MWRLNISQALLAVQRKLDIGYEMRGFRFNKKVAPYTKEAQT